MRFWLNDLHIWTVSILTMFSLYTFVLYSAIGWFMVCVTPFQLDIGRRERYVRGGGRVEVNEVGGSYHYYTHSFESPLVLKEMYNGSTRLYFDPMLTRDQSLLSATVMWVSTDPTVVQLNMNQSLVVLLNHNNSLLEVQAIFSNTTPTNIIPLTHPASDASVNVDLTKTATYTTESATVSVTPITLEDTRTSRFNVRYYNLESNKLLDVTDGKNAIRTYENQTTGTTSRTDEPLEIPSKDSVYGVKVFSYNTTSLMIEVLYSYNRSKFWGFTPDAKWHKLTLPSANDPTHSDSFLKKLNYLACKNNHKFTIEVNMKTEQKPYTYNVSNFCVRSKGFDNIQNQLKLPFFTHDKNKQYRCFDHAPVNGKLFFVDHLLEGNLILKLPEVPNLMKYVRVYHHLEKRPFLIDFVTPSSHHYYKYENGVWRYHKTKPWKREDKAFDDEITKLLDKLVDSYDELSKVPEKPPVKQEVETPVPKPESDDDRKVVAIYGEGKGAKPPNVELDEDAVKLMTNEVNILTLKGYDYSMSTIKNDRAINSLRGWVDVYYYNWHYDHITAEGSLDYELIISTRPGKKIFKAKYYTYDVYEFDGDTAIHRMEYTYEYGTNMMYLHLYTNTLFVYTFSKFYYDWADAPWKFVKMQPVTVLEHFKTYKKYYNKINERNKFTFDVDKLCKNPLDLLPETVTARIDDHDYEINTLMYDVKHPNEVNKIEFDVKKPENYAECTDFTGELETGVRVTAKPNCGINVVKNGEATVAEFTDDTLIRLLVYSPLQPSVETVEIYMYTNTLYKYSNTPKPGTYISEGIRRHQITLNFIGLSDSEKKNLDKYFELTRKITTFSFNE